MSPVAKRGPPTSVLSPINWRFSLASHRPADECRLWAKADAGDKVKAEAKVDKTGIKADAKADKAVVNATATADKVKVDATADKASAKTEATAVKAEGKVDVKAATVK